LTYLCVMNMLLCMRTTVDINDDLLIELKRVAVERRQSLKELIEDAIRSSLAYRKKPRNQKEILHLVTYRGRGVQRGVNLDSMRELLDIMEGSS
jgi:metal-responsive CopG/Arc/MetJ family transcriptional regulator